MNVIPPSALQMEWNKPFPSLCPRVKKSAAAVPAAVPLIYLLSGVARASARTF